VRYSFLKRNGLAFIAAPLGRFTVRQPKKDIDLLREIDPWLDRFRKAISDKNTPPRFQATLRQIERSIFDFCQYGKSSRFADILCSFGKAERELAGAEKFREDKRIAPVGGLTQDWLRAANDGSVEFELALALACVYDPASKIGPIRANLEPVTNAKKPQWAEKERCVVWNQADLTSNLCAVLERRLMDAKRAGCSTLPIDSGRTARLGAVAMFLHGLTDDNRIEELLWGCILVRPPYKELKLRLHNLQDSPPIPRSYALLKHVFLPRPLELQSGEQIEIRPETAVVSLLRAGRISDACSIAVRRLRAAGVIPMPHSRAGQSGRKNAWSESQASQVDGKRLAAALFQSVHNPSGVFLAWSSGNRRKFLRKKTMEV
jgi:CRISPR-associated protein Csx17